MSFSPVWASARCLRPARELENAPLPDGRRSGTGLAAVAVVFADDVFPSGVFALRLAEFLGRHNGDRWFEPLTENTPDLTFLTAIFRQFSNILIWVLVFASFEQTRLNPLFRYTLTVLVAGVIAVFVAVTIPQAAARYASAEIVGFFAPVLNVLGMVFSPLAKLMHATDDMVRLRLGAGEKQSGSQIDDEILSAVEEGEKEGVVDEQEREMIESVIEFRDTTAGHIMTARQDVVALPVDATLRQVKEAIEESRHSRIPVYERGLDHVVGILHARSHQTSRPGRSAILGRSDHASGDLRPGDASR